MKKQKISSCRFRVCVLLADEVRRSALGSSQRAVRRARRQHPGRLPHQRPQPLGGVRNSHEGAGRARTQRHGDYVVPAKIAGGQLHGHRRVGLVPERRQHAGRRHSVQIPEQHIRQPEVHRRPAAELMPSQPEVATSPSVAQQRHQVRRGQCGLRVYFDCYCSR